MAEKTDRQALWDEHNKIMAEKQDEKKEDISDAELCLKSNFLEDSLKENMSYGEFLDLIFSDKCIDPRCAIFDWIELKERIMFEQGKQEGIKLGRDEAEKWKLQAQENQILGFKQGEQQERERIKETLRAYLSMVNFTQCQWDELCKVVFEQKISGKENDE